MYVVPLFFSSGQLRLLALIVIHKALCIINKDIHVFFHITVIILNLDAVVSISYYYIPPLVPITVTLLNEYVVLEQLGIILTTCVEIFLSLIKLVEALRQSVENTLHRIRPDEKQLSLSVP